MAIHATDLLYDIALSHLLAPTRRSLVLSPRPPSPSFSTLRTLGTHSRTPSLLYLCYHGFLYIFFPASSPGCESVLYPARLMATTTGLLILRRLIRHDSAPSASLLDLAGGGSLSTGYLFNALEPRLLPLAHVFDLDIDAAA